VKLDEGGMFHGVMESTESAHRAPTGKAFVISAEAQIHLVLDRANPDGRPPARV
jgi:hypothetical protein